ncbi:hypothetical protein [Nonomuraea typhae]|uniref:hypothetical protein n=1 Tax=Nonomuraea typhae TaxID=2603600 RepID=UPI0012F767EF|nr:hypothetical protein [Nonomuraea typhae]
MIRRSLAAAVLAAAVWVVLPLWQGEDLATVPPAISAAGAPARLDGPAPDPVRYAYAPTCDQEPACSHWNLVSAGRRWWLPGASAVNQLALSADGTLAAYWLDAKRGNVVHDLTTGRIRPLPVAKDAIGVEEGLQPLFSPDNRYLMMQRDQDPPEVVDLVGGTVRRMPYVGAVRGWSASGLVFAATEPARDLPGYVARTIFTIRTPEGRPLRALTLPGDLSATGALSPSGRTLATPARQATPEAMATTGIVFTGDRPRTLTPHPPPGWTVTGILRWQDERTLVAAIGDEEGRHGYVTLDAETGATGAPAIVERPAADLPFVWTDPVVGSLS